jgi:hypothetical protein
VVLNWAGAVQKEPFGQPLTLYMGGFYFFNHHVWWLKKKLLFRQPLPIIFFPQQAHPNPLWRSMKMVKYDTL